MRMDCDIPYAGFPSLNMWNSQSLSHIVPLLLPPHHTPCQNFHFLPYDWFKKKKRDWVDMLKKSTFKVPTPHWIPFSYGSVLTHMRTTRIWQIFYKPFYLYLNIVSTCRLLIVFHPVFQMSCVQSFVFIQSLFLLFSSD